MTSPDGVSEGDEAGADLGAQGIAAREPLFVDEAHEAARAIAAMLDFAAVGIEDAIAEIGLGMLGRLDQQDLVGADAEMAVGQGPRPLGGHFYGLAHAVEHDKVVAGTLHFGEVPDHDVQ